MAPLVRLGSPLHPSGKESCRQVGDLGHQASRLTKTGRTPESHPPSFRHPRAWGVSGGKGLCSLSGLQTPGEGIQALEDSSMQGDHVNACVHTPPLSTPPPPNRVARNHRQPVSLHRKLCSLHAIPTTTTSLMIYFVFISSSLSRKLRQEERINMGFNSRPKSNEKGEERGAPGRETAWWRACEQY